MAMIPMTTSLKWTPLMLQLSSCTRRGASLPGVETRQAAFPSWERAGQLLHRQAAPKAPPGPLPHLPACPCPAIPCRATTREAALSTIVTLLAQYRYDDCAFRWACGGLLPLRSALGCTFHGP